MSAGTQRTLERDDEVWRSCGKGTVQLGKATNLNAFNEAFWPHLAAPTLIESAFRKIPPNGALITRHQQDTLLLCERRESLAHWIASPKAEEIVIEEEDASDLGTVIALLQLRQNHGSQLGCAGKARGQDVRNFHNYLPF